MPAALPLWFAPTHHDVLVRDYGLDPNVMPFVPCACGIEARRADYMVDVTGLPVEVRVALGIENVDYLCDGCTSRLFVEQHITQEEFNRLLGAHEENLAFVRQRGREHAQGIAGRPEEHKPKHAPVTHASAKAGRVAPLPLRRRELRHAETVAAMPHLFRGAAQRHP